MDSEALGYRRTAYWRTANERTAFGIRQAVPQASFVAFFGSNFIHHGFAPGPPCFSQSSQLPLYSLTFL